jgi:hypothetical protein
MPVNINGKIVQNGRKKWVPPPMPMSENSPSPGQYLALEGLANQTVAGSINEITKEFLDGDIETITKDVALRFASLNHSVLGGPRILAWLLKIEELGMQGNLKAFEILLDRAFGKVTDTLAIAHGEFEGKSDGELLKELQSIKGLYEAKKKD